MLLDLCSGSYIRPTYIRPTFTVHSCHQYFSITPLIYIHYSDHVCISFQSRIVVPHCSPRVLSTPRGFSPLPLSPWSSQDVSAISSPGCILLCLSSFLRHVNSFSAVFIGLQSSSGTVKSISDMAFDSPLGAASFFTGSLSPTWARLTAAHLNIHYQSSAHQSSDSLLSTTTGFDVCIFYLGLRHQTTHCFIVERHFLLFSSRLRASSLSSSRTSASRFFTALQPRQRSCISAFKPPHIIAWAPSFVLNSLLLHWTFDGISYMS